MALTTQQIQWALGEMVDELLKSGAVTFTRPELKQAFEDAEGWAEDPANKTSFNSALTSGNFKSNGTADQKRLVLIFALMSIIRG